MKKSLVSAILLLCAGIALAQQPSTKPAENPAPKAETSSPFKTPQEKGSYALGLNIGETFRRRAVDVDINIFLKGLKDAMAGKSLMTDDEKQAALMEMQKIAGEKQAEQRKNLAASNKQEGEDFLAKNKTQPGVVTLPSGLQYKVITNGTGPKPAAGDTVSCHYRGTLLNGTEFDSSYKRGQPLSIPVDRVIKGWTEALQLMPVGSKWQLFIPGDLAYGERGAGDDIGPNATLIFEVELLSIEGKQPQQQQPK
ncbi:MAG TPA: FKBP-type peptidyl-prolyl cis-trans isomerase [Candidatus Angelobacter sp.]|nr:FKBP-type peptidyl-prolyl cis-trans isomerase [Candidatus Angelobacter sp.]